MGFAILFSFDENIIICFLYNKYSKSRFIVYLSNTLERSFVTLNISIFEKGWKIWT